MTSKKWWTDSFPSQYYAFTTDKTLGGYPIVGLVNLDIYSKQPDWLTSSTILVALTQAEYLSINPVNLIIKDGKVQTYVAPATTDTGTSSTIATTDAATAMPIPLKTQAQSALTTARTTVYNNYGILNEPTPAEWVAYLKALMAIANGTDTTSTALPTQPTGVMDSTASSTTTASTSSATTTDTTTAATTTTATTNGASTS